MSPTPYTRMFHHVSIALAFSASSIAMLLLNKGLMIFYEGNTIETPLLLQNAATVAMLISFSRVHLEDCTRDILKTWSLCALLFCVNIYSSLMSMRYVNVPTFSVARNVNNFVTLALEMAVLNYRPQRVVLTLLALCCISMGTWLYAHEDVSYSGVGYAWCGLHVCSMAVYAVLVKRITMVNKDITSSLMSFCNCLLSLPILVVASVLRHGHLFDTRIFEMPRVGSVCLAASCLMATAISVTGFRVQQTFPAIGYITLNNVSKIPAILLSVLFFADEIDAPMAVGLAVSFFGGYAYAMGGLKVLSSRLRTGLAMSMVAMLLFTSLYVLHPLLAASPLSYYGHTSSSRPAVLVLGSGGLVGRALTQLLRARGEHVLYVSGRHHMDLRDPNALNIFRHTNIEFVYFLAYEVGGAKFLGQASVQEHMVASNRAIHANVFTFLREHPEAKFVYATSQLTGSGSPYGKMKLEGENVVRTAFPGRGRLVKFWNVYGYEVPGIKSHVIADWAYSCATHGRVRSLTDGKEPRQFTHVDDIARGLYLMWKQFDVLAFTTDLTAGNWSTLQDVSRTLAKMGCRVSMGTLPSLNPERREPDRSSVLYTLWKPRISLQMGMQELVTIYRKGKRIPFGPSCARVPCSGPYLQLGTRVTTLAYGVTTGVSAPFVLYNNKSLSQDLLHLMARRVFEPRTQYVLPHCLSGSRVQFRSDVDCSVVVAPPLMGNVQWTAQLDI